MQPVLKTARSPLKHRDSNEHYTVTKT